MLIANKNINQKLTLVDCVCSVVPRSTAKQQEMRFSVTLTQQQCDEVKQSKLVLFATLNSSIT